MVYYVAFYNPKDEFGCRVSNLAGEDKIDYICDSLVSIGENVTILSNTKSITGHFQKKKVYSPSESKKIIMFATLSNKNFFIHSIDVIFGLFQLFLFLITKLKKDDVVIVYHSLGYLNFFKFLKHCKKIHYVLEVEELYKYISASSSRFKEKESTIFKHPDAFIFSNSILDEVVNVNNKPSIVVHGVYKQIKKVCIKDDINRSVVVYAGSLEKQKGVDSIIKAAQYLNDKFELRIIGWGSHSDLDRITGLIEEIKEKTSCLIRYDGVLKGEDYLKYLQSCDIGICIQNPQDVFNYYEFPSKILSYASNDLIVIANKLAQISSSKIVKYINIIDKFDPKSIAESIIDISKQERCSNDWLNVLDKEFVNDLKCMLGDIRKNADK